MVAACSDGGADPFGKPPATTNEVTPDGTANWTLLVYMAADNNLEIDAIDDIREMQAGVSDDVNLLVLVDRAAADDTEGGHTGDPIDGIGSFAGVRLLHVTPDGIDDLNVRGDASGNADMTAPPILEQAGQMVFSQYPAEHTGVVFWDHGGGWKGFAVDESARSNLMTIDEISTSLQTIAAGACIDKFSLVSFDACLMAELSVATAVAPVADYLLASEEVVPNHGMDYSVLADAVSGDPVQFGSVMIDGFEAQSAAKGDLASVTMSLLDLSRIDAVNAAIGEMQAAVGADQAGSVEFLLAVDGATAFAYQPDPTQSEHLRDLGQIAAILGAGGTSLAQPAAAIESAVRSAVVDHMEGEGYTGSYGLSVYAPLSIEHFKTSFTDVSS